MTSSRAALSSRRLFSKALPRSVLPLLLVRQSRLCRGGTGTTSSRTALSSRRLFSKATSHTLRHSSFSGKAGFAEVGRGRGWERGQGQR